MDHRCRSRPAARTESARPLPGRGGGEHWKPRPSEALPPGSVGLPPSTLGSQAGREEGRGLAVSVRACVPRNKSARLSGSMLPPDGVGGTQCPVSRLPSIPEVLSPHIKAAGSAQGLRAPETGQRVWPRAHRQSLPGLSSPITPAKRPSQRALACAQRGWAWGWLSPPPQAVPSDPFL